MVQREEMTMVGSDPEVVKSGPEEGIGDLTRRTKVNLWVGSGKNSSALLRKFFLWSSVGGDEGW